MGSVRWYAGTFTKDPNDAGVYRYVMSPEQYSSLNQKKVIAL